MFYCERFLFVWTQTSYSVSRHEKMFCCERFLFVWTRTSCSVSRHGHVLLWPFSVRMNTDFIFCLTSRENVLLWTFSVRTNTDFIFLHSVCNNFMNKKCFRLPFKCALNSQKAYGLSKFILKAAGKNTSCPVNLNPIWPVRCRKVKPSASTHHMHRRRGTRVSVSAFAAFFWAKTPSDLDGVDSVYALTTFFKKDKQTWKR
jgi:hypothetical protein